MSKLTLYGVPLSQPFRSVAWTLLLRNIPFDIQLTVPGATSRIGSLNESFLTKTKGRTGTVPLLEVDDGHGNGNVVVNISESPAILMYLCEKYGWTTSLYGLPASPRKALIDSYMHWHHTNTRCLAALVMPLLRPDVELNEATQETYRTKAMKALDSLNNGWLQGDDNFIATADEPTIADLLAYEEIVQVQMMGTLDREVLLNDYPNVSAWVERMSQLPFHHEVHEALTVLGNLVEPSEIPLAKRLGAATKAGVTALTTAQQMYSPDSKL